MTIIIRQAAFETNSSSTHSCVTVNIDDSSKLDIIPLDEEGNVVIKGGEFGWEWETYYDAQSKASYIAIYIRDWVGNEEDKKRFSKMFEEVIKYQTGCNKVVYRFGKYDHIDHQSVEDRDLDYMFEDSEFLRSFIFNTDSTLETGNDND